MTALSRDARAPSKSDELHSDPAAQTAVIGDLFIAYGNNPDILDLDGFEPSAIYGHDIYGTQDRIPATATVTGDELTVDQYPLFSPDDPSPVLVTDDAAYIVHTTVDQTYLYRASRTSKET